MCEVYEKPEERLQPKILIRGLRDHHPLSMIHQIIMHHEYFPVFVDKKLLFLEDNTVTHHLFLRGDKYNVLGKLAKQIFGKSWEFGPTGLTPAPLPKGWDFSVNF